jgi:hypothetical protein
VSNQQPNAELLEALDWIKHNSGEEDIVFAHQTQGFWVEFYAKRPVIIDSLSDNSVEYMQKQEDMSEVFSSWDIMETRSLLSKYNTSFVILTEDLAKGIVWGKPEQELAYLIRNNETFKKEFSNAYAGVWRYVFSENE